VIDEQKQSYEFDEFRVDVAKRQLVCAGEVVPLYSKAFDLLLVMVQSGGRDLTKDELLESVWPGQMLEEANLTVNMSAVRKALGEKAAKPRFIVTIPGRGYRFVGNLRDEVGLVIETQTVSQITVEQETDDDEDAAIVIPASSTSLPANDVGLARQARQLAAPGSRSLLRRPAVLVASFVCVGVLLVASVLAVRWVRHAGATANKFQQTRIRQLTNDGRVVNAATSPDGKFYVFAHDERDTMSLRLGPMNGESPIELRPPAGVTYRCLTFAPDGASIYYTAIENGQHKIALYQLPLLGGVPVKLRDDFVDYFAISPNNKSVAIVKGNEGSRTTSLLVSSLDGTNERVLVTLPYGRGLFGPNISWSPDGSMLALGVSTDDSATQGAIYVLPLDSGEMRLLTTANWRDIRRTAWLKDNRGILMIGAAQDAQEGRQVWLVDYPSGEFRRLTNDLNSYDVGLSVTSDGTNLLLVQHQQISNIWLAPAEDVSRAKQITFGAFNRGDGGLGIDWAPNGKIIYTALVANSSTIWVMDVEGANAKELTPPGASDTTPSVTADGRFIVFQSNRGGPAEIWRMNLDGTSPQPLTSCGRNFQPSVSPDGSWVVYRSDCDSLNTLWRVPIEGGTPVRLTDKSAFWPWVSPDNKWVACEYAASPSETQLAIVPSSGGPPAKLFKVAPSANFRYGIRWTPDGKAVTYRDWVTGLWRQPIDGGNAERIPGLPPEKIFPYAWSPDGRLLAFTRGTEIRDVVLISDSR
jgi:Tol biopolymer transport system component/DNA-binding winged helix-turn-helix (wHTH) protein